MTEPMTLDERLAHAEAALNANDCREDAEAVYQARATLRERDAELARLRPCVEALAVVLPMAAGYAREHPVGRNAEMIAGAQEKLRAAEREGEG
jgi:hypothetical protein